MLERLIQEGMRSMRRLLPGTRRLLATRYSPCTCAQSGTAHTSTHSRGVR